MKQEEASKLVGLLIAAYATPAWSTETIDLWVHMLSDLEAEPARAVVLDWIKAGSDRPSIADIRRKMVEDQSDGELPSPEEAWGYVQQCFHSVGRYRAFPREYEAVARAVDVMGWDVLCNSENPEADRAHFMRIYGTFRERVMRDSAAGVGALLLTDETQAYLRKLEASR